MILSLSSCAVGKVQAIKKTDALTFEEVVRTRAEQTSVDEREAQIYNYVTDSLTIDLTKLIKPTDEDRKSITELLGKIRAYLQGEVNAAIDVDLANYLLMEFTKTPYIWSESSVDILGVDPSTRKMFVDVTYKTTTTPKIVIPKSVIAAGNPNEEVLLGARYQQYMTYLENKYRMTSYGEFTPADNTQHLLQEWESKWGNIDLILDTQNGISLIDRIRNYRYGTSVIPNIIQNQKGIQAPVSTVVVQSSWPGVSGNTDTEEEVVDTNAVTDDLVEENEPIHEESDVDVSGTSVSIAEEGAGSASISEDITINAPNKIGYFVETPISDAVLGAPYVPPMQSVGGRDISGLTYEGLVNDYALKNSATMVIRYVMSYTFNLGEQVGVKVDTLGDSSFSVW
jgi:hypothetical protein